MSIYIYMYMYMHIDIYIGLTRENSVAHLKNIHKEGVLYK